MHDQRKAKLCRLAVWFFVNLTIFTVCYLNYRLQPKHRYLYKTLSAGLCLSRAAAMVINFNLVLVWIPMCKYTLTRLAVIACRSNHKQKIRLSHLISSCNPMSTSGRNSAEQTRDFESQIYISYATQGGSNNGGPVKPSSIPDLAHKLMLAANKAHFQLRYSVCRLKIKAINSFLVAVDHSTSLHTISATTITLASVIHTVAHLLNVINFSNNFDPLLSNLNMAEYRGQNPLELLLSVPGVTGCTMILILALMSLSSISAIRNSSFDLFQIFHRLSIIFVILLILHPSSHVLKEQSNVERHDPDICYDRLVIAHDQILRAQSNQSLARVASTGSASELSRVKALPKARARRASSSREQLAPRILPQPRGRTEQTHYSSVSNSSNESAFVSTHQRLARNLSGSQVDTAIFESVSKRAIKVNNASGRFKNDDHATGNNDRVNRMRISLRDRLLQDQMSKLSDDPCLDVVPFFVAQSSICWYVLGAGLSCYLMDLILRRLRRNRNPIELLSAHSDAEGNLIELTLSNNHERFAHWLPGQFVYLNCPQIAAYEWHPFTISSMDNRSKQFTLHIKAGGDWTRKLRHELKCRQRQSLHPQVCDGRSSMSLFSKNTYSIRHCCNFHPKEDPRARLKTENGTRQLASPPVKHHQGIKLTSFDCYDQCPGQSRSIQCRPVLGRPALVDNGGGQTRKQQQMVGTVETGPSDQKCMGIYAICYGLSCNQARVCGAAPISQEMSLAAAPKLDLFIDGPFHSPFERLLDQQVSICIANGVGWTAFSSIFQQITNTNNAKMDRDKDDWWSQWRDYVYDQPKRHSSDSFKLSITDAVPVPFPRPSPANSGQSNQGEPTQMHLMIIVATLEQLKPFYGIVRKYFERFNLDCATDAERTANPVKEISAYITRSTSDDSDVREFCLREKLTLGAGTQKSLLINETFAVFFGKPNLDTYLRKFSAQYKDKRKISIYCCGSYEVKRTVERICLSMNRHPRAAAKPVFCYHEENF